MWSFIGLFNDLAKKKKMFIKGVKKTLLFFLSLALLSSNHNEIDITMSVGLQHG